MKKDIDDLTEELKEVMIDQEKNEEELKQNKKFIEEEKECELIRNELNNKEATFKKQKESLKDKEKAIKKLEKNIASTT